MSSNTAELPSLPAAATAVTAPNIATVKYWGKRDVACNLPLNDSFGLTLSSSGLWTQTTVVASMNNTSQSTSHSLVLNGKPTQLPSRALKVIEAVLSLAPEPWSQSNVVFSFTSTNSFPTAAGLASSASGYAAMTAALAGVVGIWDSVSRQTLSGIARLGSGSASRSMLPGWVWWDANLSQSAPADPMKSLDTSTSRCSVDEGHWEELCVVIAVVNGRSKDVGSTVGMQRSVETSPFAAFRAEKLVPGRMIAMESAVKTKNWAEFAQGTMKDSDDFHSVCSSSVPPIHYLNDISTSIISLVRALNELKLKSSSNDGVNDDDQSAHPLAAYTFDAGPNAVLFTPSRQLPSLLSALIAAFPPPPSITTAEYTCGTHDVSSLPNTPPELNGKLPMASPGALECLIVTKGGSGPMVTIHPPSSPPPPPPSLSWPSSVSWTS